ncbi:sugar transferase [Clostridium perfringens]|uniref:sugar transferase n=1 Tax=Clostridium perfringens TaxID=1502 RepID=UPI00290DDD6B|nr:sugar transferase [Clostridium perfringens]EJT6171570.1 sugar transferase [Clostridium perfringens]EJT6172559.1 sugar transferase [Clostridium perfringens]EJT6542295.1 sugar transferase [Clostridium perfringens]EJT6543281.1 sugar transferase [Clostridium perfringens]EJT6567303.1 sugar transferase [Clostridium perfringens]
MYKNYLKRVLDVIFASVGIIVFFPIYILVAVMVRINLGSPIIFKQKRPGKDEKIFTMYKFRSMSDQKDKNGNLLSDKERLTKFGRVLRSTSLDELPELFNILKGDMSIVGPRPLAIVYLEYYNEEEKKRHSVRPGLTGLAQINGRNLSNWDERFKNDIEYVENISFANDFKIILKTIKKVLLKEDVVARGEGKTLDFHIYRQQQLEENNKLKRY